MNEVDLFFYDHLTFKIVNIFALSLGTINYLKYGILKELPNRAVITNAQLGGLLAMSLMSLLYKKNKVTRNIENVFLVIYGILNIMSAEVCWKQFGIITTGYPSEVLFHPLSIMAVSSFFSGCNMLAEIFYGVLSGENLIYKELKTTQQIVQTITTVPPNMIIHVDEEGMFSFKKEEKCTEPPSTENETVSSENEDSADDADILTEEELAYIENKILQLEDESFYSISVRSGSRTDMQRSKNEAITIKDTYIQELLDNKTKSIKDEMEIEEDKLKPKIASAKNSINYAKYKIECAKDRIDYVKGRIGSAKYVSKATAGKESKQPTKEKTVIDRDKIDKNDFEVTEDNTRSVAYDLNFSKYVKEPIKNTTASRKDDPTNDDKLSVSKSVSILSDISDYGNDLVITPSPQSIAEDNPVMGEPAPKRDPNSKKSNGNARRCRANYPPEYENLPKCNANTL